VHLGIYEFDGDPARLLEAYDALARSMPIDSAWHLCATRPDGITIYDTCPDEATFLRFSASPEFLGALTAVGLPEPRITGRPVHAARSAGRRPT
jgi:hypothetical protein